MRIMITGGAGFVGSHLCEELIQNNNELILITRKETNLRNISRILNNVSIEKADITDFQRIAKIVTRNEPDTIIHLAGQTSHSKSFENPLYDIDVNTKSTLNILEILRKTKINCRFVLGSTFIVIGKPNKLPVNEETECRPTTIYGVNRLASENYCSVYNKVFGLDTIIFRITNSFGPREQTIQNKNAINYLIYRAFKGEELTIFNQGKFFRDLIYIKDVVNGIKIISEKGKSGNLYWISSYKKTWFYELATWLEEMTKAKVKYVDPPDYTKKVDVGNFVVDNSKLKSLGWEQKTEVKEGIVKTIKYFKTLES